MNLEELYGEYAEKNTVKAIIFFCKNDEAIEIGSDFVPCLSVNEIETSIGRYGDPYAIKAAQVGNCGLLILKEANTKASRLFKHLVTKKDVSNIGFRYLDDHLEMYALPCLNHEMTYKFLDSGDLVILFNNAYFDDDDNLATVDDFMDILEDNIGDVDKLVEFYHQQLKEKLNQENKNFS